jgi:uroporphyrin-III C-methyltransferase/precorrin-2 dehydrogenase/sirohydrochlorin ferrochelatase
LVHTATGVVEVDAAVTAEADAQRTLVVNAAEAEKSSAWVPSVGRFDGLTVATFGGGDPRRGIALRDSISSKLLDGTLPIDAVRGASTEGRVALVGGGPGADDLVTVRGQRLLNEADVVVTDRLGPRHLLSWLRPEVEIIDVGKSPNNHPVPQEEINQILVDQAKLGKKVVRLKGGDPYVLGRGGEELDFCIANGVQVEVVPGITSAISVPALAGIPVTHRGVATSFTVTTGHVPVGEISGGRDHTVVILMGVATLAETAANLAAGVRGPECPIAVIEDGYGSDQRITRSTLGDIAKVAEQVGIKSPAVIVIGDVVTERNKEEE